jgi:hypothetical protein
MKTKRLESLESKKKENEKWHALETVIRKHKER